MVMDSALLPCHMFRVHDATHNVGVNAQIKVEDQLRYPGPAEIKMAMQSLTPSTFVLAADVARAHRLVLVRKKVTGDSMLVGSKIWLNTVGTFGVTRLFAGIIRCAHSEGETSVN